MLLKTILNTVEKHKSFVYSDARWSKQPGREIEFDVQPRKNSKPICSGCGRKRPGYEEVLKNSRWCLLKRKANLTKKQVVKLRELMKYNLRSVKAYLMREAPGKREQGNRFWTYTSGPWAGKFLREWCTRANRSKIEPMKKLAKTLLKHESLLLNWFESKGVSSGIVEGFNNKAKLTMRKAYGFKTFENIQIALFHQLGKLPEPKSTHRFC